MNVFFRFSLLKCLESPKIPNVHLQTRGEFKKLLHEKLKSLYENEKLLYEIRNYPAVENEKQLIENNNDATIYREIYIL